MVDNIKRFNKLFYTKDLVEQFIIITNMEFLKMC